LSYDLIWFKTQIHNNNSKPTDDDGCDDDHDHDDDYGYDEDTVTSPASKTSRRRESSWTVSGSGDL
jgi:hypothetical protein